MKAKLILHGRPVPSIFNLLGQKENDITYSLGWALSRCPAFLNGLLRAISTPFEDTSPAGLIVRLQEHAARGGFTDIEILGHDLHVIVEAKRGWALPSLGQLEKYVPRFSTTKAKHRAIVTLSECSATFAAHYSVSKVRGVPVTHLSWRNVSHLARAHKGSHAEKRLLGELRSYLSTIVAMQPQTSNLVFVVALNRTEFAPGLTFIQIVENRARYFHPYGTGRWPTEPPNYIGFRYGGILQSVHHIEHSEVIRNFRLHFPECEDKEDKPHFLYSLGPAIRPPRQVRTGKLFRNHHVQAMLDLLLTSSTVAEARDRTKARLEEVPA